MSDSARPEILAFRELETLVRRLGDELAGFRRRALLAESRLKELEGGEARAGDVVSDRQTQERLTELEHENAALRARLEAATARTKLVLDRVRFMRQQAQAGGGS